MGTHHQTEGGIASPFSRELQKPSGVHSSAQSAPRARPWHGPLASHHIELIVRRVCARLPLQKPVGGRMREHAGEREACCKGPMLCYAMRDPGLRSLGPSHAPFLVRPSEQSSPRCLP